MPFYEYQCANCSHHLEAMQKISDAPLKKCPECGKSQLRRLISAPVFRLKGGGWYETDFKSDKDNKRNLHGADEAPKSAEEGKGDAAKGSGEGKADAAKPDAAAAVSKSEAKSEEGGKSRATSAKPSPGVGRPKPALASSRAKRGAPAKPARRAAPVRKK